MVVDAAPQQSMEKARLSMDSDPPMSVGSSSLNDSRALSYLQLLATMLTLVQVRNKSYNYIPRHKFEMHIYKEEHFCTYIEINSH